MYVHTPGIIINKFKILEWVWLEVATANWFFYLSLFSASYCRPPACHFYPWHPSTNVFTISQFDSSILSGFISITFNIHCLSVIFIQWCSPGPGHPERAFWSLLPPSLPSVLNQYHCLWAIQDCTSSLSPVFCSPLLSFMLRLFTTHHTSRFSPPVPTCSHTPSISLECWPTALQIKSSMLFYLRATHSPKSTWVWTKPNSEMKMSNLSHVRAYGANKCDSSALSSGCPVADTGEIGCTCVEGKGSRTGAGWGMREDNKHMLPRAT